MEITAEISLYPFSNAFKNEVKEFISHLKKENPDLLMTVNGMSTQIAGSYGKVMDLLNEEIKKFLTANEAVFVLKIAKGCNIDDV